MNKSADFSIYIYISIYTIGIIISNSRTFSSITTINPSECTVTNTVGHINKNKLFHLFMQILQTKKIHGLIETNSPTPMMDDTRQRIYVLLAASHGRRLVENSAKQKLVLCAYTAHSTTESIRERLDELSYRYQIEKIFFLPSPITHRGAMKQGQYRFFPQNVGIVVHTLINMILNIQQFGPVVVMDSPPRGGETIDLPLNRGTDTGVNPGLRDTTIC